MIRLGVFFLAFCGPIQPVDAGTILQKAPLSHAAVQTLRPNRTAPQAGAADGSFELTTETEVLLDGKPCAYKKIPKDAVILRVELEEDGKTILRIEFRSNK